MRRLHKQILSIDESTFTIPKMFENDEEVYKTINTFFETIVSLASVLSGFSFIIRLSHKLRHVE